MAPPRRKLWLDWQRGLAVLFMVEVHILDAWLAEGARVGWERWYTVLMFLGGLAAPGFLYMAGLSQALADEARARKGVPAGERRRGALERGLWLLGVAYLVRLYPFVVGGAFARGAGLPYLLGVDLLSLGGLGLTLSVMLGFWEPTGARRRLAVWGGVALVALSALWRGAYAWGGFADVLKVDVLNVIAIGMMLSAVLAVGRRPVAAGLLAGGAALLVALATPALAAVLAHRDAPEALRRLGEAPVERILDVPFAYLYGVWPRSQFKLFNWVAFLLAGAAVAPLVKGEGSRWRRAVVVGGVAVGLVALGRLLDALIPMSGVAWWTDSPAWFLYRLSIHVGLTAALHLLPDLLERPLAWLSLLGRQSLPGYIISVELTYGLLPGPLRHALSMPQLIAAIVAMTVVTWAMCRAWEWWGARGRPAPAAVRSTPSGG